MDFKLVQGVDADNLEGIHSAYCICDNGISAVISAELIGGAVKGLLKSLEEPVFFFVELPCGEDEEKKLRKSKTDPFHYNLYYLDNCTLPVADAIMKRYGDLLINDGLCRFGFGSHKSGEEIYCMSYQSISVYGEAAKFEPALAALGVVKENEIKNLWDNFTKDTPGTSLSVEINGETVYDIPVNLKSEGMYLSDVIE
ncbi:hypothetical protein [Ruminococcus sp. Marseille-P6503]|uniref:hypothetical protein n=1 Tax=Ruminococcus sp. Marseille-P6503 TaxID=2364796 RepID=UPI000F533F1E|nr:hypothetical protein [Ruminococcus sp. Marseille-P6503]